MINEPLQLKQEYFQLSDQIIEQLENKSLLDKNKLVIGVCGESASGKSVTAKCLHIELHKRNISSFILHQDNYYLFPPKDNHEKRKLDLNWVGIQEVKLDLMQAHMDQFRAGEKEIAVPVVDYLKNEFTQQLADFNQTKVLIVEGVYSFYLERFDYKIFMARNYKETREKRQQREREVYDPFVEQVLEIEHKLIQPLRDKSHLVIEKDYTISL